LLEEHGEEILGVYALPEAHRKRMRTTNMLERQNQELKRRVFSASLRCRGYLAYFLETLPRRRAGKSIWLTLSIEKAIGSKS